MTLKNVDVYYCNINTKKNLTLGPIFYKDEKKYNAIVGTKEGELIKIPLIFSKIEALKEDFEILKIKESKTINLKELFLDQEFSSNIVGYYKKKKNNKKTKNEKNNKEFEIIILKNGTIYKLEDKILKGKIGKVKKLLYEFDDSFNHTEEFFEYKNKIYFFITTNSGYVLLLDENGKEIIKFNLNTKIFSQPKYFIEKNTLFIGGEDGNLYSFEINIDKKTIKKNWEFKTEKSIIAKPAIGKFDGNYYILFGSTDKNFYCINLEGELTWKFKTEGRILSEAFIEDVNNDDIKEIIFGSCDDKVYVLNSYGNEIWDYETDFWVAAKPMVLDVDDDLYKEIFVGSYDNKLYCFSPDPDFVPTFFSGTAGIIQQNNSIEEESYFAKLLFKKEVNGMIIGMNIIEEEKILALITNKGEFRSFKFEKK